MSADRLLRAILVAALLLLAATPRGAHARIFLRNSCPYDLTAFSRNLANPTRTYFLSANGGESYIDFGSSNVWEGGVVWASRNANLHNGQATQIEFNIGADIGVGPLLDFYDISQVNAYNEPVQLRPINAPASAGGSWCGAPSCVWDDDIAAACTAPNFREGPDGACINAEGPGLGHTAGTSEFKERCPQAYSFSKDDETSMYACAWGTDYEVEWCPGSDDKHTHTHDPKGGKGKDKQDDDEEQLQGSVAALVAAPPPPC